MASGQRREVEDLSLQCERERERDMYVYIYMYILCVYMHIYIYNICIKYTQAVWYGKSLIWEFALGTGQRHWKNCTSFQVSGNFPRCRRCPFGSWQRRNVRASTSECQSEGRVFLT